MAGLTTFLTMAYIVAVNPAMMEAAGIPFNAALTATCFGAAIMTAAMGLIANRPIALASGMGINAIVAYTLCGSMGLDWRIAMGVVFLEGVIIMVLVLMGLREAVMDAIPVALRQAIGIGIGLFVAFIGLKGGGILAADSSTLITMGSLTSPEAIVAIVSIALAIILTVRGTKGGLLISIIVATVVGIPLGVTALPTEFDHSRLQRAVRTVPAAARRQRHRHRAGVRAARVAHVRVQPAHERLLRHHGHHDGRRPAGRLRR